MHALRRLAVVPSALALALLGAPVAASAAPPQAGGFTYTEIAVPGADYTAVTGVNNRGVLVGYYGDSAGRHGFVDDDGVVTTVDVPGTDYTALTSINDAGTATGTYLTDSGGRQHAFLRSAQGVFTWLDDPEATGPDPSGTVASDVNDGGTVVGYYFSTAGGTTSYHGFVWWRGDFTTYDVPGSSTEGPRYAGTQLFGVSNAGVMVGRTSYLEEGVPPDQAVVVPRHSYDTYVDPAVPGNFCGYTHFVAINSRGSIAGNSGNGCAPYFYAWLKDGSAITPVQWPAVVGDTQQEVATVVGGLNDRGVVVGSWRIDTRQPPPDPDSEGSYLLGAEHGFVATPTR